MNVQNQIDRLIAQNAALWYEKMKESADLGDRTRNAEFVQWLAESPRHLESFLSIAGQAPFVRKAFASGAFDLQKQLRTVSPDVAHFPAPIAEGADIERMAMPARRRRWRAGIAAAAIVAAAVCVPLFHSYLSWQRFETPVGEQRTIQLAEGSVVNLNASSHLEVRFEDGRREIRLERGEATFNVAHDALRPFRVHTPDATVQAVGTRFNVYARPDGTTAVAVLDGKVSVTGDANMEPVPLAAGEATNVHSGKRIEREKPADVTEAIAWQQRKLIFRRTSLADIATEFNRYNKATRIRLEAVEPGRFRYSGAFNADDPESLALFLEHEPDLTVERLGREIVVRSK
ncbi:MAG: FecR domain-containing protein [Gammaproteobacteria bacterium]